MDLLTSLGVNSSLFIQFGLFVVVYLVLKHVLFEPYVAAFRARSERTVGQAETAERFVAETHALEEQFSKQAALASEEYRVLYDSARLESQREYDRLLGVARESARALVEAERSRIASQMDAVRAQLSGEIGAVSRLVNEKLIGKDLQA